MPFSSSSKYLSEFEAQVHEIGVLGVARRQGGNDVYHKVNDWLFFLLFHLISNNDDSGTSGAASISFFFQEDLPRRIDGLRN
mmetsp:Transcript_501/g.1291  ORF Transcript_501/g.1291 Transcript_501/m.1291 type:complete len:82 (-) Transcript_501:375-620(-)